MATNNKVFVSPGVYTSEVDLSFVSQSVGVTTLGIVGETQKGPAFEPMFIRNFDDFSTYFGGTSPEKFINTQIPKYEAAYIAKSYLQQSNQLFVTRVLGLSGYDAGPSWSIKTIANVDKSTVDFSCSGHSNTLENCIYPCTGYTVVDYSIPFTGYSDSVTDITFGTITGDNGILLNKFNESYTEFNGSTSNIKSNFQQQIYNVIYTSTTLPLSASSLYVYGTILGDTFDNLYNGGHSGVTNVFGVNNVDSHLADYTAPENDPWYYALFDNNSGSYSGSSFYSYISNLTEISNTSNCATFYNFSVSGTPGSINYLNNTITVYLTGGSLTNVVVDFNACTSNVKVSGATQVSGVNVLNFSDSVNNPIPYVLTPSNSGASTTFYVTVAIDNPCNPAVTGHTGSGNVGSPKLGYSGTVIGKIYVYTGTSYTDFDDLIISTLRSK